MSTSGNTESVAVQIAPIIVEVELSEPRTNETDIWNNNISQLFPIASISQKGDKVMAFIDIPFSGYTIETGISNGVFEGKAIVRDTNNVIIAKFHYSEGKPSGKCKAYYSDGSLFFTGMLCEGYREGIGVEYDREGNVLFHGYFHNGKRGFPMIKQDDYIVEYNSAGNPTVVFKKNKKGLRHGICYRFVNGRIDRAEKWENGEMIRIVKDFCGKTMTEFNAKGKVVYVGGFVDLLSENYPRNGRGVGRLFFGKYEFVAEWKNGISVKEILIHSVPYVVFVIIVASLICILLILIF